MELLCQVAVPPTQRSPDDGADAAGSEDFVVWLTLLPIEVARSVLKAKAWWNRIASAAPVGYSTTYGHLGPRHLDPRCDAQPGR